MKTIFFLFAVLLATFATAQPKLSKTGWVPVWTETFSPFVTATPFTNDRWSRQMPFGPFFSGTMWTDTNVVLTSRLAPETNGVNYDATLKCYRNPVAYNVTQAGTPSVACYWNSGMLRTHYDDAINSGENNTGALYCGTQTSTDMDQGGWLYGMFEVRCKVPRDFGSTPDGRSKFGQYAYQ